MWENGGIEKVAVFVLPTHKLEIDKLPSTTTQLS